MTKLILALVFSSCRAAAAAETVAHDIKAGITPERGFIEAEDRVTLPSPRTEFVFSLHKGLAPQAGGGAVLEALPPETAREKYGINFSSAADIYETYRLVLKKPARSFTLRYKGAISHPLGEQVEEYARSFSETPGIISPEGCYLSGSSGWYPYFEGSLVTFRLETLLPEPYTSVSGGDRTALSSEGGRNRAVWEARPPQDDITLTCGKYTEYRSGHGKPVFYAFLRSPDKALADKYLETTGKYVEMYSALIGPYPYGKFALVENFWETGYGIPSFTLLGPKVMRLPFILNSSYPHEILHNWWGNGVFVDYEKGNWCEGLTAYLADYLIAEGRGKGREYRVTTLQKYSDYVAADGGKDFPLTAFRSRRSSASEAVGYGKSLMFYHMLRRALGDDVFKRGLREFYARNKYGFASFAQLREAFERRTGAGRLAGFFEQWTERPGAPRLALRNARVLKTPDDNYELEFTLAQTQPGKPYALEVPAAIYLENSGTPRMKTLFFSSAEETFHYSSPLRPVRLEIDPEFDVFRQLSPLETPPTLSRVLGARNPEVIIPGGPDGKPWETFAAGWTRDADNLPVLASDTLRGAPPPAASYWVLGDANRLTPAFESGLEAYGARFAPDSVTIDNRRFPREGNTFVFAAFNPADPSFSGALILSAGTADLRALSAKLPHYGKYSWLVFDSSMTSLASGLWEPAQSPLAFDLGGGRAAARVYPAREPLAAPASVFSEARMKADVAYLAGLPGGRGQGSEGHKKAAAYAAGEFRKAGLEPFGGAFIQPADKPGRANVIGVLKGTSGKEGSVILSAHYDHLQPKDGAVFPGADDNASGMALLLELARYYAAHPVPRTLIFAAFDGEEDGRLGSRAFASALPEAARRSVNAALNFDTAGRLGQGKLLVLGSASSDKWPHILRGAGFVTGMEYDLVKEDLDPSDQASFTEKGIPAVQFFSGPKPEYHKPSDTPEKIDLPGIARQADFAREIIDYLAGDSDFITRPDGLTAAAAQPRAERRASTGLVPDFAFQGSGVRAQDVTPGSPLAGAGVKPGDVVVKLNGVPTPDLRAYSQELKKFSPGGRISVTYLSDGAEKTADIELAAK